MKLSIRTALAFVALMAGAASAGAQTPETAADLSAQTLSPGDQIRIVVWRKPEMTCDCVIAGNGTVIHPLYREISVVGVPMSVVEDRLRTFLAKYEQTPQFVIQPLVKVVVRGEVRSPNIYAVPPETTIAQAILLAGGPTDRGRLDKVVVVRDRQEIKMDLSRPETDAMLLQIRSNDQVIVGRARGSAMQYIAPISSTIAAVLGAVALFRQ